MRDQTDAGEQLADILEEHEVSADLVLAIPRGGLPIGRVVADELDVPLDVIVSKKIGAPRNPELAVGSAASDGSIWLNEELIERLGLDPEQIRAEGEPPTNLRVPYPWAADGPAAALDVGLQR